MSLAYASFPSRLAPNSKGVMMDKTRNTSLAPAQAVIQNYGFLTCQPSLDASQNASKCCPNAITKSSHIKGLIMK
jgi:hypothetical protein